MNAVAISPDGTWLATASSDRTVRTWAADGTPRAALTGHQGAVLGVAISPDGTWLATAGSDGTVRTWAADGTPRAATAIRVDGEVQTAHGSPQAPTSASRAHKACTCSHFRRRPAGQTPACGGTLLALTIFEATQGNSGHIFAAVVSVLNLMTGWPVHSAQRSSSVISQGALVHPGGSQDR